MTGETCYVGIKEAAVNADCSMAKPFTMITALLLLVVAAGHAYRLISGFPVIAGGFDVPLWVSWPGMIVPALLAVMIFRESRK